MVYHKYVLIPLTTACYLMIAGYVFFFGCLRVPTRRCNLVVPADWGWGRSNKISLFSPNRQQHSNNFSYPIFNARDALGRTPLESVRAYASIPPNKAETEGAWVRRWDAVAGRAGADRATCLRLLERAVAAAAADVARDDAASTAASSMRVGGVSLRSGRRTERDKKNIVALYGCLPVIETQQPTKNTRTQRRR